MQNYPVHVIFKCHTCYIPVTKRSLIKKNKFIDTGSFLSVENS
ncbi:hypothetical protein BACCOPRO_02641 [Phocaeicola coprophilus DSM 18228 = JCM 13818]|uniref:Uncharacterized protein n=1 Tax=Phocaeicola coprophilus DSM 18228 = JCM 13818 TaxID=547042 RepID=S0F9W6_9BACT|nr:hypothetical protein BACCOPRO_02641 [Phocaeicola coprophilus DSM 18228 = JCM 13818]